MLNFQDINDYTGYYKKIYCKIAQIKHPKVSKKIGGPLDDIILFNLERSEIKSGIQKNWIGSKI